MFQPSSLNITRIRSPNPRFTSATRCLCLLSFLC
ncbi:hypothetical protein RDI58_010900 [Solanum bulbocastanum]|uniref:Uncharacterized protein n=1 Tax=Solanum bulbocastanum TaxID=147425 RepID=A0AAN8TQA3_SOLBU